jgi:hypothetical protein
MIRMPSKLLLLSSSRGLIITTGFRQGDVDEVVEGGGDAEHILANVRSEALLDSKDIVSDDQNGVVRSSEEIFELLLSFTRADILQFTSFLCCLA